MSTVYSKGKAKDILKPEPVKQPEAPMSRENSIESQVAFKGFVELITAGKVELDSMEGNAIRAWGLSKLSGLNYKACLAAIKGTAEKATE